MSQTHASQTQASQTHASQTHASQTHASQTHASQTHVRNFGNMPIHTRTKDSHQPDLGMSVHAHKPLARKTTSFWFYNKAFLHARPKKRSARKLATGEIWSRDMSPKFLTCVADMMSRMFISNSPKQRALSASCLQHSNTHKKLSQA